MNQLVSSVKPRIYGMYFLCYAMLKSMNVEFVCHRKKILGIRKNPKKNPKKD